jgi:NADPH:quinone reductase-like Zn-dependent oxidoreductase
MAKLHGLAVIGSAGNASSLDLLRQMKLDHVIDYRKENVVEAIMHLTGGKCRFARLRSWNTSAAAGVRPVLCVTIAFSF